MKTQIIIDIETSVLQKIERLSIKKNKDISSLLDDYLMDIVNSENELNEFAHDYQIKDKINDMNVEEPDSETELPLLEIIRKYTKNKISSNNEVDGKKINKQKSFTKEFRKKFPPKSVTEEMDYKKIYNEHRDKKYGYK